MRLNKILGIMFIFLSLILSACSQEGKEYKFHGKSNNWIVKYETEISNEREWADVSFEYIGKEPVPAVFGYNLKSSWFEITSKEERFNQHGKNINSGNSECTGPPLNNESCAVIIEEDEQMEANIEWDGNSEVIILNRK
ncbi:hypothetical protein AM499_04420 [Bacillus sp. FJAT-22090]|uniref:hypothetical protein n=1 Tax=Bacillus sp. FJAT-22090 TaxID=1581038 RepID=UPI0006AF5AED|nr:hypothetical protein [Bacillus sp. FJAT-22090]ALC85142.1 hypothetical protein AM499_04420 [Bacillus sp. FJAT-22090]